MLRLHFSVADLHPPGRLWKYHHSQSSTPNPTKAKYFHNSRSDLGATVVAETERFSLNRMSSTPVSSVSVEFNRLAPIVARALPLSEIAYSPVRNAAIPVS